MDTFSKVSVFKKNSVSSKTEQNFYVYKLLSNRFHCPYENGTDTKTTPAIQAYNFSEKKVVILKNPLCK